MLQLPSYFCFLQESSHCALPMLEFLAQRLERHVTIEVDVAGQPDLTNAPLRVQSIRDISGFARCTVGDRRRE